MVPKALRMIEKSIDEGLIEELPGETPIQRYRRTSAGRFAADTVIATQVKVDEASLRHRDNSFMDRLLTLVEDADRQRSAP